MLVPVLLAAMALWAPIFGNAIPFDVTGVLVYPPWEEARPAGFMPPTDSNATLESQQYYPDYAFICSSAEAHEIPLWCPLEAGGKPFFALWRTRCLSPFTLPFYFLPLHLALTISALLKLTVAGWTAYYAARRFALVRPLALAAALAFELSAPMILYLSAPMTDVLPWTPLLLAVSERLGTGFTRGWPQSAIIIALMTMGGGPQTLAASLMFVGIYIVLRIAMVRKPGRALAALLALGVSTIAGLALAGVQLVPYFEFMRQASKGPEQQSAILYVSDLMGMFFPAFWDFSADASSGRDPNMLRLLYVGLIQVWLAALWFSVRKFSKVTQRRRMDCLLTAAVTLTVLAFLRGGIPLIRRFDAQHLLAFNALTLGLTGAAAGDAWLVLTAAECKRALKRMAICLAVLALIVLATLSGHRAVVATATWTLAVQFMTAFGLFVCFAALLTATLLRPSVRMMGLGVSLLTFIAFWGSAVDVRTTPTALAFPETSFVKALKESEGRVGGSRSMATWPVAGNLIPQVYSAGGSLSARQAAVLDKTVANPMLLARTGIETLLLSGNDMRGQFAPLRPALSIREVFGSGAILFDYRDAKPRAWIAYETRSVEEFSPDKVDPSSPPVIEHPSPPPAEQGPDGHADIVEDSTLQVAIDADTTRPGVLVLSDAWYPGWQASIDGQSASIFPVDGMFRGVELPEGKHRVVFDYAPNSLWTGIYTSLCAAAIIFIGFWKMIAQWIARRNRPKVL